MAFRGNVASVDSGIYRISAAGGISVVADENTSVPGGQGTFTGFNFTDLNGGKITFQAFGGGVTGIYKTTNNVLGVVADTNSTIPTFLPSTSWGLNSK